MSIELTQRSVRHHWYQGEGRKLSPGAVMVLLDIPPGDTGIVIAMPTRRSTEPTQPGFDPVLIEFLEGWSWFGSLPPRLASLLVESVSLRKASAGEFVVRAGEPCLHWFGLIRGLLQMYVTAEDGAETTLVCMRAGQWGGDGSLLKRELMRYDLRALTAADICLVPASTFDVLRRSSIDFSNFLCEVMNARMGEFVAMLAATRLGTPESQVVRALLMMTDGKSSGTVQLRITQHELALISGLSRQRVNAVVTSFGRQGIVRSERRKGYIDVDVERLLRYPQADPGIAFKAPV